MKVTPRDLLVGFEWGVPDSWREDPTVNSYLLRLNGLFMCLNHILTLPGVRGEAFDKCSLSPTFHCLPLPHVAHADPLEKMDEALWYPRNDQDLQKSKIWRLNRWCRHPMSQSRGQYPSYSAI